MYMQLDEATDNHSENLQVTKRRIQIEGVQIFNEFYFHPALDVFRGELVEVRYDATDKSRIELILPNQRAVKADLIDVVKNDDEYVDNTFDLIEAKAVNRTLVAALWQSLEIRGIFAALNDPLGLQSDKVKLRERYLEIEKQIRAAIKKGDEK